MMRRASALRCTCGARLLPAVRSTRSSSSSSQSQPRSTDRPTRLGSGDSTERFRYQRQTLSPEERSTFADLIAQILPSKQAKDGSSSSALAPQESSVEEAEEARRKSYSFNEQLELISAELAQRAKSAKDRRKMRRELTLTVLTPEQEIELDRLREEIIRCQSDYAVLAWTLDKVFGFEADAAGPFVSQLPRDAAGPRSPLYAPLLLSVFVTLRDTHKSPELAMHVFNIASSTTESFIRGCTAELYEEVLRTRWIHGAGDIQSILGHVETMVGSGLNIHKPISDLIDEIGQAIRTDQALARAHSIPTSTTSTALKTTNGPLPFNAPQLTPNESRQKDDGTLASHVESISTSTRFFSSAQIAAWNKLDQLLARQAAEAERARKEHETKQWAQWALRKADQGAQAVAQARSSSPNLFFDAGQSTPLTSARSKLFGDNESQRDDGESDKVERAPIRDRENQGADRKSETNKVNASWAKFFDGFVEKSKR